jgi:hypothetical protein
VEVAPAAASAGFARVVERGGRTLIFSVSFADRVTCVVALLTLISNYIPVSCG